MALGLYDWIIVILYLILLLFLSAYLSKFQKTKQDYFVANRNQNSLGLTISILATQCSTNSILGAPAFVAFASGGGLIWLQYELAIPLAMIVIMIFLFPLFYHLKLISVYEYLERRFDTKTRLILSGIFQFIRVFATAVTVYSIAIVVELISGLSFFWSVILIGLITIIYDFLGGIKAIIYSDIIQMIILILVLIGVLFFLISFFDGFQNMFEAFPKERKEAVNYLNYEIKESQNFNFWAMLFGGIFLYISYYGCDQSQVQKELCAKNQNEGQKILFLNGILRFPIVLLYCLIGVGIGSYSLIESDFLNSLPRNGEFPNYNLAVPIFLIQNLPQGIVGLTLVALFAAAMSSIDSVINSLSATTVEDFLKKTKLMNNITSKKELFFSRIITIIWGIIALCLAFSVEKISGNVLIAINKIGSLINGPILGVFILAIFTVKTNGTNACFGLITGFVGNIILWIFFPNISWLWWNVIGFFVTFTVGYFFALISKNKQSKKKDWSLIFFKDIGYKRDWLIRYIILFFWFLVIFCLINIL